MSQERLLSVEGLRLSFAGNTVLHDVDFAIAPGALVSLIGPNGAGKTSLFNCVTGFYRPQSGRIRFGDADVRRHKPHGITGLGIARTFQNVRLFKDMTVMQNVMAGMHCRSKAGVFGALLRTKSQQREEAEIRDYARECLDFVGLGETGDRIARTLPYGHQRLVEIARALATQPRLLMLDEPAAGLNSGEKDSLIALIRRIRDERGVALLLIEHDTGLVMNVSERISVLDHGAMIAEGTPSEIQKDPRVIEAYLGQSDAEFEL